MTASRGKDARPDASMNRLGRGRRRLKQTDLLEIAGRVQSRSGAAFLLACSDLMVFLSLHSEEL